MLNTFGFPTHIPNHNLETFSFPPLVDLFEKTFWFVLGFFAESDFFFISKKNPNGEETPGET